MKISILGCGWLGLPLGKFLVEKGHVVKGSTTSEDKISLLASVGIEPFLIKFSPQMETMQSSDYRLTTLNDDNSISQFLDSEVLIICIPPRAGKFGEYIQ